jgi:hypothetical protein
MFQSRTLTGRKTQALSAPRPARAEGAREVLFPLDPFKPAMDAWLNRVPPNVFRQVACCWLLGVDSSGFEHQVQWHKRRTAGPLAPLLVPREKRTMSGIDDLIPKSDDRWATAARRAQGIADLGVGRALKTYYTLYFPAGVIILVVAGTVGGMLSFGGGPADWPSFLVFGCFLAVLGAGIGGLIYNAKKLAPAAEMGRIDVLLSLEDKERKDIRRQILGKTPVDPDHLVVSRAAAVQLRKSLATQLIWMPVLSLIFIPQALLGAWFISWFMAAGVVVLVIGEMFVVHDFQRAGRFLDRTAEPGAKGPPE